MLKKIIRAFGFGADEEEVLADSPEMPAGQPSSQPALLPAVGEAKVDEKAESAIFEKVVEVINASLPPFLSSTADPQKQREYLYSALDESMQAYVKSLRASAMAECEAQWAQERSQLQADADSLRERAKDLEKKKAELSDRKLSADRQKRALSERVHDLEEQVLKLESDKEQLEIENKCMLNKAKAAAVLGGEESSLPSAEDSAKVAELESQLEQLKAEREQLAVDKASLEKGIEAAEVKDKMNAAMLDDFKRQAFEATKALKNEQEQMQALRQEREVLDARIADLQRQSMEKDARLQEQVASLEEIAKIQEQVSRFDEVKNKMDEHIGRLKSALKSAQQENAALRDTIKNTMAQSAEETQLLQQRIDQLQAQIDEGISQAGKAESADGTEIAIPKSKKRRTLVLEDVDDLIQGADWMVSTPPNTPSMRPAEDNDSFGYQPPQRKQKPADSDQQPSLFDF